MISDVKPGSVMVKRSETDVSIYAPGEPMYSSAMMIATHHWFRGQWMSEDELMKAARTPIIPTFLSMRDCFVHMNGECRWRDYGVLLNGRAEQKWETADSERGYVDIWFRFYQSPKVIRHRLFGEVQIVPL